jgi:hypothetical protein
MGLFDGPRRLAQDLEALGESIVTTAPRRIAERVTAELQDTGPAWSGTFRNAWRILPGDQSPAPSIASPGTYTPGDKPDPSPVIRQKVPALRLGRALKAAFTTTKTLYTIANLAEHRLTAMDLQPSPRAVARTAPRDWFATYLQGGQLNQTAQVILDEEIRKAVKP